MLERLNWPLVVAFCVLTICGTVLAVTKVLPATTVAAVVSTLVAWLAPSPIVHPVVPVAIVEKGAP